MDTFLTAHIVIQNCKIVNVTQSMKPFLIKYHETYTTTNKAVSLINNSYRNIKESEYEPIFYDDLFDKTNCLSFGQNGNASGDFITNLPIIKIDDLIFYKIFYNSNNDTNKVNMNKIIGKIKDPDLSGGATTYTVAIPNGKRYCLANNDFVTENICTIRYTDGTIQNTIFTITGVNISIYNIDSSKTVKTIIFNNDYIVDGSYY